MFYRDSRSDVDDPSHFAIITHLMHSMLNLHIKTTLQTREIGHRNRLPVVSSAILGERCKACTFAVGPLWLGGYILTLNAPGYITVFSYHHSPPWNMYGEKSLYFIQGTFCLYVSIFFLSIQVNDDGQYVNNKRITSALLWSESFPPELPPVVAPCPLFTI